MSLPVPSIRLTGHDLVLREWEDADLPAMTELFDEPGIARRTPLRSPFDLDAAREYLRMIRRARTEDRRLHLAITADGDRPLGEVLLSLARGTMGYAVSSGHRGQRLAPRATGLLRDYAYSVLGLPRVLLEIEADNAPSVAVARALGFRPSGGPGEPVSEKGRTFLLDTWVHDRPAQAGH